METTRDVLAEPTLWSPFPKDIVNLPQSPEGNLNAVVVSHPSQKSEGWGTRRFVALPVTAKHSLVARTLRR
jgi:hypothetical protein